MKKQLLFTIIFISLLTGCRQSSDFASEGTVGEFSIYLVKQKISAQQMMEIDLSELELGDTPILSVDDIVAYTGETHEIDLTDSAYERIAGLEVPVTTGIPFVVCIGRESIYGGAFWVSYSSVSFNGIVIDTLPAMEKRPIRIQLGYPKSPELFVGEDLRSDARILQSLKGTGKLK